MTPELDAQGGITNNDELDAGVAFAAASPALVQAQQLPTVDGATLTLVYATPVPDWQVALDVNVPAHVVGQTALGVEDPTEAAAAVTKAIVDEDKAALSSISAAWRTDFDADALAQHVDQAVSTGPYVVDVIVPGERVELVRNDEYQGDGAATLRPRGRAQRPGAARAGRRARGRARSTWWLRRTRRTCSTRWRT